jgi:hypothetical protein
MKTDICSSVRSFVCSSIRSFLELPTTCWELCWVPSSPGFWETKIYRQPVKSKRGWNLQNQAISAWGKWGILVVLPLRKTNTFESL